MLDWLVAWGVSSAVGFAFKEVLAPLAKGALEDYTKDFFKERIKDFTGLFEKDTLQTVTGKALKEFLALVQDKLAEADVPEEDLPQYVKPLKQFITNPRVRGILGGAFAENSHHSHYSALPIIWQELNLLALPDGFNWELVTKLYLKKVKALIRESDELREIFDSQQLAAIAENTRELAGIIPAFDLRQYQEGILEKYGNLKLDSLDTDGAAYNRLKLWKIFIPQNVRFVDGLLPQVYQLPKEHLRRMRDSKDIEGDIEEVDLERYRRAYGEQAICSVLDIINDKPNHRYLVILGDPGAGKSSLLQYLALNWANSPLNNVISLPIPLLIELRTYMRNRDNGNCHNFLEFFHQSSGAISHLNQHQLQEQLKTGKVLVMFDGLDEVFDPGKREDVITDIHRFTNEYPNVQVIVTSRVIGYKPQRLRDAEFHHFMLQDLDEKQIEHFVYRWHELTFSDEADKLRKKERLQRAINTSKAIQELAGNPLLLTMMAILNRNQELPRDRAELYNQSSRLLLHQWDVERALIEDARLEPNTIDYKDKQAILRLVAYQMQGNTKGLAGNLISATDLERIITDYLKTIEVSQARILARVLRNQLRSRNFILCDLGADYYAFIHRTFLEYFCAWEFVWQFKETQTLSLTQLKEEVFGKHWQDESWHEVLRLIIGMVESSFGGEIIEYLRSQSGESEKFANVFLAADCLSEVRNRNLIADTDGELLVQIKGLTKYDLSYSYEKYGDEAKLVREIRVKAVNAIAINWQDDPNTLPWLKERVTNDDNSAVRYAAVEQIVFGWQDDSDTLPLLKQTVTSDYNSIVRYVAVRQIAFNWQDDPDILPLLKKWATSHDDEFVRQAAVQGIAEEWKDDPDTLPLLKERVTNDDHWAVRRAAVEAIAEGWKDAPDTLPLLKEWVTNDDDSFVRLAAVEAIAEGWKDAPDTLP
ncbi:NACHT domain-containing protein, partial [Limnofasciculus baicalensis]